MGENKEKKSRLQIAYELFDQGKRPSDPEIKVLGLRPKSTYDYFQRWKREKKSIERGSTTPPDISTKLGPTGKPGGSSKGIEIGKITILPENWGMTQYGAVLILDTFNKAKKDIGYEGTVGEFLCDICSFYRRIVNYKEVEYAGGETEGDGERGGEKNGETGVGRVLELAR